MSPLALLCSTALTGSLLLPVVLTAPAHAQALYGATGGQGDDISSSGGDGGDGGDAGDAGVAGNGADAGTGGTAGTQAVRDGGHGENAGPSGGGGGGGGGYSNIIAGDISAPLNGGNGGNGGDGGFLDGGYGGGGAGGDGARNAETNPAISVTADVHGGDGGDGDSVFGGGGGGGAGMVLLNNGAITVENSATVAGGNGGNPGPGSGGGGGGAGIVLNAGGGLTNHGDVLGGAGGAFATGGTAIVMGDPGSIVNDGRIAGGQGGFSASAGAAIDLRNGGTIINGGVIIGGEGDHSVSGGTNGVAGGTGSGGAPGYIPQTPSSGNGGTGIIGANLAVLNDGVITGGDSLFGRANAITFTGGANTLSLRNGSIITGNVVVESGATGSLTLGDYDTLPATPAFDVSKLVNTATVGASDEFVGFTSFKKDGTNTVTLTGTGAQDWTIDQGTLVGDTNSFGGNLTFSGVNSGIVVFDQASDGTYAGTIAGPGHFAKTGAGTLTLSGDASDLAGNVGVMAGTLDIDTQLTSFTGIIATDGTDPDEWATARVSGSATWTADVLRVGDSNADSKGKGSLIVENGGQVFNGSGVVAYGAGSTGSAVISGNDSGWTLDDGIAVGLFGNGSLSIEDGGQVSSGNNAIVGWDAQATGIVNITGRGSVWTGDSIIAVGVLGKGTLTLSEGGQVSLAGGPAIVGLAAQPGSFGTLNIGAASGEVAKAAGTVDAASIAFGAGTGTVVFNHLGNPDGSDLIFSPSLTGLGTILHESGTTVLAADSSSFTGATIVAGGTLVVGDHASAGFLGGTINVEDGATLGGSGTVGTTTVADGGHIAPGNSVGALTIAGNLGLSSGSILDYEFGNPGGSAGSPGISDRIGVSGNLTLDGTLNLSQSGDMADGTAGLGYYRLMTYGGSLTDNGLEIGTKPPLSDPAAHEIQAGGGNVDLFIGAAGDDMLQHWQGGDGTWNATNEKWLNQGSAVLVPWAGNHAVFKNEPGGFDGGTIAVEGTQGFKGLQFVDSGYRLEGPGTLAIDGSDSADGNAEIRVLTGTAATIATTISGAGGISKTQGGTLVLEGSNSYQGGTRLLGGIVSVSSDANLGAASGGLTFNGGALRTTAAFATARDITLDAGGGTFQTDADLTANGVISGTGALTKTGAGGLTLSSDNSYAGGTTVSAGSITAATTGALGSGLVNVLTGGDLNFINDASAESLDIAMTAGADMRFDDSASAGTATIVNTQGRIDFYNTASADSAAITSKGGVVGFHGVNTADGATIINDTGGQVDISGLTSDGIAIGSLSGDGSVLLGSKTLTLGGLDKNDTIGGVIADGPNGAGGTLTKIGAGQLTLTGANTYTGATYVNGGTLQIGNGGMVGSILGNVDIGSAGTFALNRGDGYSFAGALSGVGHFVKSGTGTLLYDGDGSGFAGNTTIAAGGLIVGSDTAHANASLGGSFDVGDGGTLGGHGTVGSGAGSTVTIASGGTIAPGNSIGTLHVAGDYTQKTGSTYMAEIDPAGHSDLIDVSGKAALEGGTVFALKAPGGYSVGTRYTLLTAGGGVTGSYATLDQNTPFVDLALAYDPANVYLDVTRNDVSFCDVASTRNQCATANGAESTGPGNPIYDAIAGLPDDETAREAFNALSGEIHASAKSALIDDSHFVRDAINDRLRGAFEGVGIPATPVLAYGEGGPMLAPATTDRFAAWGTAFGSWGSFDGDGNAASLDTSTGGFLTGVDGLVAEDVRLGIMTGYSHTSFDADGRSSSGSSDNYHLGLYGGTQWGALAFRSGLAYTWHDIETSRSVAMPGFADSLSGDYNSGTFQAFGELGHRIDTPVAAFEPFANLAYVNLHMDGFTEKGGAAALASASQTTDATFTTLGLRASAGFTLGTINATARGMLGWRHAYGDIIPASTHAFSGGGAFTIAGVPIAKDSAAIEAGLDLNLTDAATLSVAYQGQFGSGVQQNGFNAKLNMKF
jgi:outer membrane autotransporter protein